MRFTAQDEMVKSVVRDLYSPTKQEKEGVKRAYNDLQSALGEDIFRSGSFARYTAIRPIHDLDVIYPTNDAARDDPKTVLSNLKSDVEASDLCGMNNVQVQSHSISLIYDTFNIDIVPAVRLYDDKDSVLLVPEVAHARSAAALEKYLRINSKVVSWIKSDPKFYIRQAKLIDDSTNGNFRCSVRLMKAWKSVCKDVCGDDFKLKSFHIEQEIATIYLGNPSASILDALILAAQSIIQHIGFPHIVDVADDSMYVDEYTKDLNDCQMDIIIKKLNQLVNVINRYGNDDNIVDKIMNGDNNRIQVAKVKPLKPWC